MLSEVLNAPRQAAAANGCSDAPATAFPCSVSGDKVTALSHLVRNDCGAQLKKHTANKVPATQHPGQGSAAEGAKVQADALARPVNNGFAATSVSCCVLQHLLIKLIKKKKKFCST